jgi:hypothetical protein
MGEPCLNGQGNKQGFCQVFLYATGTYFIFARSHPRRHQADIGRMATFFLCNRAFLQFYMGEPCLNGQGNKQGFCQRFLYANRTYFIFGTSHPRRHQADIASNVFIYQFNRAFLQFYMGEPCLNGQGNKGGFCQVFWAGNGIYFIFGSSHTWRHQADIAELVLFMCQKRSFI